MTARATIRQWLSSAPAPLRALLRACLVAPVRAYTRFAPWSFGNLTLYRAVADHLWALESEVVASTRAGAVLLVDATSIVGKHIYYFGVWEPVITQWITRRLSPGDTFVNVDANVGYYTTLASSLVGPTGRVVSIEALPQTYQRLVENLARIGRTNVRTVNLAPWDSQEQLTNVEGAEWRVLSEMATWLPQARGDPGDHGGDRPQAAAFSRKDVRRCSGTVYAARIQGLSDRQQLSGIQLRRTGTSLIAAQNRLMAVR